MDHKIKSYFDNLPPGKVVKLDQAKDPELFKQSAFDYIDLHGHSIGFVQDYTAIKKYDPIPTALLEIKNI
ncbi:MAG: hypothetical protein EOO20_03785 [Chryseobacterium sp.]|nr:MAG: hypothetical protein EOO20_03785 [Chryseobacterium sp.]